MLDRKFSYNWKIIIEEFAKLTANRNIWSIFRRLVIGAAVYFVWHERNNRLFQKVERTNEDLIQIITETIKMRMMSFIVRDSNEVAEAEGKWNVKLKRIKVNV